jgi:peptide-methionine (R)-S-oxide reductase
MNRRNFLAAGAMLPFFGTSTHAASGNFKVTRTDAEWRAMLSDAEYRVMRKEGTERAFSSPLDRENRSGVFVCRGCDLPLYASQHKFDSGTGWPSFWQAVSPSAIGTSRDRKLLIVRTECHCSRCGSHLGHIFGDGPAPTGKRHCINGVSLKFIAA